MDHVYRKMRLVTVGVVAAASIVAGMVAFWHLAPREVMAKTPTSMYLAILAMLAGPIVTIVAWAWDRKARIQDALASQEPVHEHAANRVANTDVVGLDAAKATKGDPSPTTGSTADAAKRPSVLARRALPGNRHRVVRHVVK